MAAGYRSVYSGADFMTRFRGAAQPQDDASRADYENRRRSYDTARMESAESDMEYADQQKSAARATFGAAWQEIGNDRDGVSPFTVARDYALHSAKMGNYIKSGQYDKAYSEYRILNEASENGGDRMFALSTSDPAATGRKIDSDLQTGAENLVKRSFAFTPVTLWNGEQATADDIFRDGETYKKFGKISSLESGFTKELVDATRSDDEFERKLAMRISSPVVNSNGQSMYALQFRDIGDYVFGRGEIKRLREELGDAGTERLVEDAMTKGVADGTYVDRMNAVRDIVWQQLQAGSRKDAYRLVRDNLDAFDRKVNSLVKGSGIDTDAARRGVSKVMTIAAEESPGAIDFDDERVSARLDRWIGLLARAERMGIPLLSDSHEGGLAVRKAVGDSFTYQSLQGEPDEANAMVRMENAFNMATGVLSAGSVPVGMLKRAPGDSAAALGFSSGDDSIDTAMKLMASDLLNRHILQNMYRGEREDVSLARLSTDVWERRRLAGSWGDAISASLGLSPDTGAFVANSLVSKSFVDGGAVPVDLKSELAVAAFDPKTPEPVAKELRRYAKARDLVGDERFGTMLSGYRRILTDPLVGWGMRDKEQISANLNHIKNRMVAAMEEGADPSIVANAAARRGFPYKWTGEWVLPDGVVISGGEYRNKKRVVSRADGAPAKEEAIDVRFAIPLVGKATSPVDLDLVTVELPSFGGVKGFRIGEGSWTGNEAGFLGAQAQLARLAEEARKLQLARASKAAKKTEDTGIKMD